MICSDLCLSAGEQLEAEAAQATPPHQYVPWILVDGVPLGTPLPSLTSPLLATELTVHVRTQQG